MHRCPSLGSCLPTLTRKRALLATSLIWFAGGCGPGAATPMPEPPSILPSLLGPPTGEVKPVIAGTQGFVDIEGGPGAAPANATIRVTDLDKTDVPYSSKAFADGHFVVSLPVDYNDELRFEWQYGDKRSKPTDVLFLQAGTSSFRLQPSPRFDCVQLTPGFVLEFANTSADTLTLQIENQCASDLSVGSATLRRSLPDFVLPTGTPGTYPPGNVASLAVSHVATGAASEENTLFVALSQGGTTIRYPITLSAQP